MKRRYYIFEVRTLATFPRYSATAMSSWAKLSVLTCRREAAAFRDKLCSAYRAHPQHPEFRFVTVEAIA